jgi:hypothetical protein
LYSLSVECREVSMRTRRLGLAVILLTVAAASPFAFAAATADKYAQAQKPPPPPPPAAAVKNVTVTVTYTGKGPVDAGHGILVFLFSDPNIGAQAKPLSGPQIVQKNGGSVTFKDVTTNPVYIAAVYNEKGSYDGVTGPPPPGTPWAVYKKDAKSPAIAVTPGPKTTVKMSFSDATRFGG